MEQYTSLGLVMKWCGMMATCWQAGMHCFMVEFDVSYQVNRIGHTDI